MLRTFGARLRAWWRWDRIESDLDEEIQFHLSEEADERASSGSTREEAAVAARKDFGSTALVLESTRDVWRWPIVAQLAQDLRYALRSTRRHPGSSAVAILTLAVGIGASAAIVSIVDAILLQPLPYTDSDRLIRIVEKFPTISGLRERGITYQEFSEWRGRSRTLANATAVIPMGQRTVKTRDGMAALWGAMASGNLFDILGTHALFGRTLTVADEARADVIVLSFPTWQQHFNADPAIVGTAIELRAGALVPETPARLLTVVGILPNDFGFEHLDFFMPVVMPGARSARVMTIGLLAPGVSRKMATEEANAIGNGMRPPWPSDAPPLNGPRFEVQGLKERAVMSLSPALRVFVAAVLVIFFIVCANVANLLLTRGMSRRGELAVRLAIGASRARIVRQILTECLLLAVVGAVLGATLAVAGVTLVKAFSTLDAPGIFRLGFGDTVLPRAQEVHVSLRVFGIAFGIAVCAMFVFGLVPALTLSRTNYEQLKSSYAQSSGPRDAGIRNALVVAQLVMATVLLVAAGLLTESLWRLSSVNKGYDERNVVAMNLLFPDQYSTRTKAEKIATILSRLRRVPNVEAVGFARHGMLIGEELVIGTFVPAGRSVEQMAAARIRVRSVSDGFLTAMGVPILSGRELAATDDGTAPPVVVMNQQAARLCFGTATAVGQFVAWNVGKQHTQVQVVGVVENVRQVSLENDPYPEVFINYPQLLSVMERSGSSAAGQNEAAIGFLSFAVLTAGDPAAAVPVIRGATKKIDANVGIDAIVPMARLVRSSLARQRLYAVVVGVIAGVAGFLAAIGIYGVLSYSVTQRTREIGIRMALGARRAGVLRMVLRQGLALAIVGIALGLMAAVLSAPALRSLLFGITPLDVRTFVAVSASFGVIAAFACYAPARRATTVDPLVALRNE